jgi:hypothetical protein
MKEEKKCGGTSDWCQQKELVNNFHGFLSSLISQNVIFFNNYTSFNNVVK